MLSATSVKMFGLRRLLDGAESGVLGVPEFQRDFDWTERDMKSLLATVFSGWPSGSLLVLEGRDTVFALRPIEGAPPLRNPNISLLDGQQRLTSLYQALFEKGETAFAIKWDIGNDQEIDDCIVSYPMAVWARSYASLTAQLEHRIVPLSAMKSPSEFFAWRDEMLKLVPDASKREALKSVITDVYTYRLSAIHEYEFPVVSLDERTRPDAVARIFEKVNKTGQKLGVFDLMVAKTFEPNWNLRDKWSAARTNNPHLQQFLGEDGLPVLQTIALIVHSDLRQSAVLALTKHQVHEHWERAVQATGLAVDFFTGRCGVANADLMPYPNLLPPVAALFSQQDSSRWLNDFETWFWYSAFASSYDAAANTRLVAHYKGFLEGKPQEFRSDEERAVDLLQATRKTQKSVWNAVICALSRPLFNRESPVADFAANDIDVSTLFSVGEIDEDAVAQVGLDGAVVFRSVLNAIVVPKRFVAGSLRKSAGETLDMLRKSELGDFVLEQIHEPSFEALSAPPRFFHMRLAWLLKFLGERRIDVASVIDVDQDPAWQFRLVVS